MEITRRRNKVQKEHDECINGLIKCSKFSFKRFKVVDMCIPTTIRNFNEFASTFFNETLCQAAALSKAIVAIFFSGHCIFFGQIKYIKLRRIEQADGLVIKLSITLFSGVDDFVSIFFKLFQNGYTLQKLILIFELGVIQSTHGVSNGNRRIFFGHPTSTRMISGSFRRRPVGRVIGYSGRGLLERHRVRRAGG